MAESVHTSTGAVPAGAHGKTFPPFASETFASQLLWFAITFGLLYWLMSRLALPRIGEILENRTNRIADDLADAERLRAESAAAGAAYEKSLAEARARAKVIAQEAREALMAESDVKRKTLEAELAGRIADAEATISARTAEAMASVRGIAADAATAIVERLTGKAPERAVVEAALDRAPAR
ncbi:MAG TPA: F0F1 ATP synthase subunit B [Beijerinckiaceae bacterium]|jgi:F-type H+-transporting ATPase subunit b|nr:F0F1 ATP synthase subunit B [Beijerinckiaceae bacterium]